MNEMQAFLAGLAVGCVIARYFVGVGNKISLNAQDGEAIDKKKQKPTIQDSTE